MSEAGCLTDRTVCQDCLRYCANDGALALTSVHNGSSSWRGGRFNTSPTAQAPILHRLRPLFALDKTTLGLDIAEHLLPENHSVPFR